jgi:uncharacterized repeat protein (TIGR03803 family)
VRQLESRLTPSVTTLASFLAPHGADPFAGLIRDGSGNLYGTAAVGGAFGRGTVFELAHGSGTITTLTSFNGTNGRAPFAALIMDSNGNLYGTTAAGGASDDGTVFELAKGSGTITTLASFNGTDGAEPEAALVMDGSGNLYGTTAAGGASGDGTVFELVHGSGTVTTLVSFNGTNGGEPFAGLLLDGSGNLYGTTAGGGASNDGTVFELAKGGNTVTTLASFSGTDGASPYSTPIMDGSGNLYGTTAFGGASGDGTVFELVHRSGTITTLASFNKTNGADPQAGLVRDSSGNLYGTTFEGGATGYGTVFGLAHGSSTITTLASFNLKDGAFPEAGLVMDGSGNLYGTTAAGGAPASGTVFELAKGAGTITTLAAFDNNGQFPQAGLIMDRSGNLYGTTQYGGAFGHGTVFEMGKGSGTITTLASFKGADGSFPYGSLGMDGNGNLYGTTRQGGAFGRGTVFELAKASGAITRLASFDGTNGAGPLAGLIIDGSGNLYGTTYYGGASKDGTVFEVAAGSGTITTLASFNGADGKNPAAALIMDSHGNLYGTAEFGGAFHRGTVFELAKGSGTITTLASFNGRDGALPFAGLVMDRRGNLYGTTPFGGVSGDGTVFEVVRRRHEIMTLASFKGRNGANSYGTLIMDRQGNLYGTTAFGGTSGEGTVFEVVHRRHRISTLASFNGTNGADPFAGLIMDGSGNLYGTTQVGGAGDLGAVFELPAAAAPTDQWTRANFAVNTNGSKAPNVPGGMLDIAATIPQAAGTTLKSASWTVAAGSAVPSKLDKATAGNFTQQFTGTLTIELGGTDTTPTFGQLISPTGTVALAGHLNVTGVVPAVGSLFEVLDNQGGSVISGIFKGLPEGATFGDGAPTFQITYAGTDADGNQNVIITRIS